MYISVYSISDIDANQGRLSLLDTLRINATPLKIRIPPTSNLVEWGTPTLIPNVDEPSPTLKMLYVVYCRLNTAPPWNLKNCSPPECSPE